MLELGSSWRICI